MVKYHLTAAGKIGKCTASVRPCPRGPHINEDGKARIKAGKPESTDEKRIWNILSPGMTVNLSGATPSLEIEKPAKRLSSTRLASLEDYAGMDYYDINRGLRDDVPLPPRLAKVVDEIDEAFKVIKPETPYTTYRGEVVDVEEGQTAEQAIFSRFFPGSKIESKNFFSTSLNPSIAAYFAKKAEKTQIAVVLEVKAKTGISMQGLPDAPLEDEMLLPRNSSFTVSSIRPYSTYQNIEFSEESAYLKEESARTRIFTIVLEEN